jgi:hypothetical protein
MWFALNSLTDDSGLGGREWRPHFLTEYGKWYLLNVLVMFLPLHRTLNCFMCQRLFLILPQLTSFAISKQEYYWALVACAPNPNYLGILGWEGCSSRRVRAKSSWNHISTNNWAQLCAPVIPDILEAEVGRIMVPSQSRQKSLQDPLNQKKLDVVVMHLSSQLW